MTAPTAGAQVIAPPATQELVTLRTAHATHSAPGTHRVTDGVLPASRPITGGPTVLPVVGHGVAPDGAAWLAVMLPGRPNGRTAWIAASGTVAGETRWHLVVVIAKRLVLVYRDGRLLRSLPAIVGKPATPTPRGRFFVEESVRLSGGASARRSRSRSAPAQTFCRSSPAARVRSPCTGSTTSVDAWARRCPTAASASLTALSPGSRRAPARVCR